MKKLTQAQAEMAREMVYHANRALLDLLQLTPDHQGYIRSKLDWSIIAIRGKNLKLFNITKDDMQFRPFYNTKLMTMLFSWFTNNLEEDGRKIEYWEYGPGNIRKDKITLICKEEGYPPITSEAYSNDSLRFFDMMCQLAEIDPPVDLQEMDALIG